MILCVISVPGTGEMLEIQIRRPGPDFVDFSDKCGNRQAHGMSIVNEESRCFGS